MAYIFLVPAIWWLSCRPSYRSVFSTFLFFGWLYYITLLWWLRHVTFPGLILGSLLLSGYLSVWFLLARWMIPRVLESSFRMRLCVMLALSAAWTTIEWIRCQFTLGFPWCPLSVSQWERPAILQAAEWGGGWIVSFFLVFFNLCVASYVHHLLVRRLQPKGNGFNWRMCPDFYVGLLFLLGMLAPFFLTRPNPKDQEVLMRVGFVQPYLVEKWQTGKATRHKETLGRLSLMTAAAKPDIILWPEASTPYAITEDGEWVEALSRKTNTHMLIGAVAKSTDQEHSYNAVCLIKPRDGLDMKFYAKRILVPFGEYVPAGFGWIPDLDKLVGPTGRFTTGGDARTLALDLDSETREIKIGPLICYEDIFPTLARQHALEAADALFVMLNENGSVYFEGAATFSISRDKTLLGKSTFFTRHGDLFAYASMGLSLFGFFVCWKHSKRQIEQEDKDR